MIKSITPHIKKIKNDLGFGGDGKGFSQEFGLEQTPYRFTPSFFTHNGKVATIVQLYVRSETNRNLTYHQPMEMIPVKPLKNIEIYLIFKDRLIKHDDKDKIILKNSGGNKEAMKNAEEEASDKEKDNERAKLVSKTNWEDYGDYELILGSAEPVVVARFQMIIVGHSQKEVEEQLLIINTKLDQLYSGAQWDSLPGEQLSRISELFAPTELSRFNMTSTGSNYAGLNFCVSNGIDDPKGIPIGIDALSPAESTAFFDFDTSTKKLALIAMPATATMSYYHQEDSISPLEASSLIAQGAANHMVIKGARVKHMVFNNFNYLDGPFYAPSVTQDIFDRYDASRLTINPLEGFGEIEDVLKVFPRLLQKTVNIFDLLQDLKLTQADKAIVLSALKTFYISNKRWSTSADKYPKRTSILNIKDPKTFPTMGAFLSEFTTLVDAALHQKRESKADRTETLHSLLEQALSTHIGILGRPTSIRKTDALQTYYHFAEIESVAMRQVQFVNMIDYVIWTCSLGDCVIIHGADKLYDTTLKMVSESIKAAQRRGVRFIFTYDELTTKASRVDDMSDVFTLQGTYYSDLDADVDWTCFGRMSHDEVARYERAMNTELSDIIRNNACAKAPRCQALIHRASGNINNFVHMNVVI
jgi:hypothetical protein